MTAKKPGKRVVGTIHRVLALLLLLLLASAVATAGGQPEIIVSGLSIIDLDTGQVREKQTLTIRDGIIRTIAPDGQLDLDSDFEAVHYDAAGRFAFPGLWDMHVHLRGGPDLADANRLWMRQYVGYGVTSIRDAGGDIPDDIVAWREDIAERTLLGPRIFTSLRKVDGSPILRQGSVEIDSTAKISGALESLNTAGADFIKVNDGAFPDSVFLQILAEARSLGLKTAAHVPVSLSAQDLADNGLGSIEHAYFMTKFASGGEKQKAEVSTDAEDDPFRAYFGRYNDFAANADDNKAAQNFRHLAEGGVAVVPTLYLLKRWFVVDESTRAEDDPGYFETPAAIVRTHGTEGYIAYANSRTPERAAADRRMVSESQRLVGLAARLGVTILAGSDTGTTNTFMYPGDSLHQELAELVGAGLSPREALRAATVNPASWFGLDDLSGSLQEGKWADVVIVDENPLEDIRNTRKISAVIRDGTLYDREALERLRQLPDEAR